MKLKRKLILLPILTILTASLWGCSTFNSLFYSENKYFTPEERPIIDDLALSIDFRRGYDDKMELNYVYAAGKFSKGEYMGRRHLFVQTLRKYKKTQCLAVLKKVYQMEAKATLDMKEYKEDEDWDEYTYISTYIMPEIKLFISIFESSMGKVWRGSKGEMDAVKVQAEKDARED